MKLFAEGSGSEAKESRARAFSRDIAKFLGERQE